MSSMFKSSREFGIRLLEQAGVPVNGREPWSVQVTDERLWNRVIAQPQLGFGEAYMDGWWECEQMDEMLTRVLTSRVLDEIRPGPRMLVLAARSRLVNRQTKNNATRNASHHYDIGNDLYERMLDKRMVYSCAYWKSADNLNMAQDAKLELICQKLQLQPGMHLLDIGCGWGGLLQFASEHYGIKGTGISLSANQVSIARQRCSGLPIEIQQIDYRVLRGTFDRIVSVGMMEHVGPKNLQSFFQACDGLLVENGIMLHHTIGGLVSKQHTDPFFDRYIFPGGVLPSLAQIGRAAEPNWVIEDVHNIGPDYDRTLMAWCSNIESRWDELPHYRERFRRMWRFYLLASAAGFRSRSLQLWQVVMRRKGRASRYEPVR